MKFPEWASKESENESENVKGNLYIDQAHGVLCLFALTFF